MTSAQQTYNSSAGVKADGGGKMFQAVYPGTSQNVTVGASSTQSTTLGSNVSIVRVVSTSDCYLAFGSNPTATTSKMFLPAGVVEYVGVQNASKIAVIQSTAGGTLNITEGSSY